MKDIHDETWSIMRAWIGDINCLGAPPTIDLIEALLLLSENLPRDPTRRKKHQQALGSSTSESASTMYSPQVDDIHGAENRQAWMLIGTAIRCAYNLGIEKVGWST